MAVTQALEVPEDSLKESKPIICDLFASRVSKASVYVGHGDFPSGSNRPHRYLLPQIMVVGMKRG